MVKLFAPTATLPVPPILFVKDKYPTAVFELAVFFCKLPSPIAVLKLPTLFRFKLLDPTAVLFVPVVFDAALLYPKAVLGVPVVFDRRL